MKHYLFILMLLFFVAAGCSSEQRSGTDHDDIFSFVVMGHIRSDFQDQLSPAFLKAVRRIKNDNLRPRFIVLLGDSIIGYHSNIEDYKKEWLLLKNYCRKEKLQVFVVPGNHDYSTEEERKNFEEIWNKTYFSFKYKNSKFLILDSNLDWSKKWSQRHFQFTDVPATSTSTDFLWGTAPYNMFGSPITGDQLAFLKNTLHNKDNMELRGVLPANRDFYYGDNDYPAIKDIQYNFIFVHHILFSSDTEKGMPNYNNNNWFAEIHPMLIGKNVYVFGGDAPHTSEQANYSKDGVTYASSFTSGDDAFYLVRVYKDKVDVETIKINH